MADLTRSNVTIQNSWSEGSVTGKRHTVLQVTAVLTAAGSGAATAKLPAAAFGMSSIIDVSDFVKSDNSEVITASPNYANTEVLLSAGSSTTPTATSGTYRCIIKGVMS